MDHNGTWIVMETEDQHLKLPVGEKVKTHEYVDLLDVLTELKENKFTGYLEVRLPDHGLHNGGEGAILFIIGDIIAASYETGGKVYSRTNAFHTMFEIPTSRTSANAEQYAYDETDIWLAIERNKFQLFEYEPPEKIEVEKPQPDRIKTVKPAVKEEKIKPVISIADASPKKPPTSTGDDESEDSFFVVAYKKKEKKLTREQLLSKYKLHDVSEKDADSLIDRVLGKD